MSRPRIRVQPISPLLDERQLQLELQAKRTLKHVEGGFNARAAIADGIDLGYPECCVTHFAFSPVTTASLTGRAFTDLGFVACPNHSASEAREIAERIRRRKLFRPFGLKATGKLRRRETMRRKRYDRLLAAGEIDKYGFPIDEDIEEELDC